jgi:hypothetical protein
MPHTVALPDVAYYYPEPYWGSSEEDWVKTLLLFFDGIAILMPRSSLMHGPRAGRIDPMLGEPLIEANLLHILSPEDLIDQQAAEDFASFLVELMSEGALDNLPSSTEFEWLSGSRMAMSADRELSNMILEELGTRGLVGKILHGEPSVTDGSREDVGAVQLHPTVRRLCLSFWAQALRRPGERMGYSLQPVTSRDDIQETFVAALKSSGIQSEGKVVQLDLENIGLDLSLVPLEEVLQFREEHGLEHRRYMRSLRRHLYDLERLEGADLHRATADRQDEIRDSAAALRKVSRAYIGRKLPAAALGVAGAILHALGGNPAGAAASAGGAAGQLVRPPAMEDAYSYLFRLERSYGGRRSGWFGEQ